MKRSLTAFDRLAKTTGGSGFADVFACSKFPTFEVPLVLATKESLRGFGDVIEKESDVSKFMKNSTWPKTDGWRRISSGTGNEQLPTVGTFSHYWSGSVCHADNSAVSRSYKIGIATTTSSSPPRRSVLARELNYHPCGSQCIYPRSSAPFVALLGSVSSGRHPDDVGPGDLRAFLFGGAGAPMMGLCIPAGVWHQPVYAVNESFECLDMQSSVHACVVVDTIDEWGVALNVPLSL